MDEKCDTEILKCTGLTNDTFQRLSKILTNRKILLEIKKRVVNRYEIALFLVVWETLIITSHTKNKLAATEIWFYRSMLTIQWAEYVSNVEALRKIETQRSLTLEIRKRF